MLSIMNEIDPRLLLLLCVLYGIQNQIFLQFYAEGFDFLFDNTSLCCPCVYISLSLSLHFIFCCGCDFNWLRLFINSVYSLCSFSTHFVFVIKLELVILFLGV